MEDPNPTPGTDEEEVLPPVTPAPDPVEPESALAPQPPVDYEKKFKESSREAQILASQLDEERKRNKPLTTDPTEQELRALYPEWDTFTASDKAFAKENLTLKRTAEANAREIAEIRAEKAWEKDLANAVKTFPALKGKEDDFEKFVMKPTHKGTPIETLARAFLNDPTKPVEPAKPADPPPKGGMERPGGGPQHAPKPKLLTGDELKVLRETDNKAYMAYIKANPEALDID